MGDLFGGGGGGDQQGGFLPNQPLNIPVESALIPSAIWRATSALPFTASGNRTIDYGFGEYNPQTMGMQLPTFQPTPPQQNPFLQQKQLPLGGFAYQPPVNNVGFNPMMAASPFRGNPQQGNPFQGQPAQQPQGNNGATSGATVTPNQGGTA